MKTAAIRKEMQENETCRHGNHPDFCADCDCARQLVDESFTDREYGINWDEVVIDRVRVGGKLIEIVDGGGPVRAPRDEDDHRDLEGKKPCERCWLYHGGECA